MVETFSELANPGRPLPLAITTLTGITDADLRRKPPSRRVLDDFLAFLGDDVLVAHNAEFESRFLQQKSDGQLRNTIIDTLELCRILYPALPHHDLDSMVTALELEVGERHRALADARLLVPLWARLSERLESLPFEVVAALSSVATRTLWPARNLFLEAESRRLVSAFDLAAPDYRKRLADHAELIDEARRERRRDVTEEAPPVRIDVPRITALFEEQGPFDEKIEGYEIRREQVRMAELVGEAFNDAHHLLVEAGTGVGKSMAYLVPAIHWATTNRQKVVVSTNTKNLQEQLYFNDLPLLQRTLDIDFQAALIKGRRNYLCVRKLLYLLEETERELTEEECVALLAVIVWAAETEVGDVAENAGFLAFRERDLWPKLCASSEECPGPACSHRRRCFLSRARSLSMLADIVVANHAVVFSEIGLDSVVLPEHAHLIFDEAHNIEDVATDYLGCEIDRWGVVRLTRRLVRRDRGRRDRGLLPSVRYRMKKGRETSLTDSERDLDRFIHETYISVGTVEMMLDGFLDAVQGVFEASGHTDGTMRYEMEGRDPEPWAAVEREMRAFIAAIGEMRKRLAIIAERLDAMEDRDFRYRTESIYDIRGASVRFEEVERTLEFLVAAEDESFVYWITKYGRRRPLYRMGAAPIRIGPRIKEVLYDRKDTIIFTSATLSTAGKFTFLKDRIGLDLVERERLVEEDVGSPFDYDSQMLVLAPAFIPEPGRDDEGFLEHVTRTLIDLFRASEGRGLGLFTSYSMLDHVYGRLKSALEAEKTLVLGQGRDGGRRAITRMFRRETHSVLLGTDSFWEGVDVPGESLSCLAIVRLPFAVHTAPIVQARCEEVESRGRNPFIHYTLPSAVIRFKQGVGRLIRTKTDRGVVVVLDGRVLTRRYGGQFLRSLPTGHRTCASPRHLCDMVRAFLAAGGE
jgi:predicted DnaQ family exonuclease/DinG family helicase